MKLLIVVPYPLEQAPSQRFRIEQYLTALTESNISWEYHSFWDERTWAEIYKKGRWRRKILGFLGGFLRRLKLLLRTYRFDAVYLHREATPVGPPWFEWWLTHVIKKPLVFDFDDAIWLPNNSSANGAIVSRFKYHRKTAQIIKWSSKIFCGNHFLGAYARQFNSNVTILPTTIDTENLHNRQKVHHDSKHLQIGWTGTHSTLRQLDPVFDKLEKAHYELGAHFTVICDTPPDFKPYWLHFVPWNRTHEINQLLAFDVGIMPLYNTPWEQGKCGFKALQYMALGIPAVVSSVGVNRDILRNHIGGTLIDDDHPEQWLDALRQYLPAETRNMTGKEARARVEAEYSVLAWTSALVSTIKQVVEKPDKVRTGVSAK